MKTMAIRELSAPAIQEAATRGQIIGIMNDRSLAAVLYPIGRLATERLIKENLSRVMHNINRGERQVESAVKEGRTCPPALEDVVHSETGFPSIDLSSARKVNLRDLSGKMLAEAARMNESIALTTNKSIAGIVYPVPENWVSQLISQNLPRLLRRIDVGEQELAAGNDIKTLDDAMGEESPH